MIAPLLHASRLVRDYFSDLIVACMMVFATTWEEKRLWWRDYRSRSKKNVEN